MAYNEALAGRVRKLLERQVGLTEKKMFGGVAFMVSGNMACGVSKDSLMVRINPESHEEELKSPHTRTFDLTGKEMKGWLLVDTNGIESNDDLEKWVAKGVDYAMTLPPK